MFPLSLEAASKRFCQKKLINLIKREQVKTHCPQQSPQFQMDFAKRKNIVKLRQGSGKDRQGMAVKAKGPKA